MSLFCSVCSCVFSIACLASLGAADIRVDPAAGGAGTGASWADARTSLTATLAAAVSGDRIWVKAGTYRLSGARTSSFVIKAGVALYGGFAGDEDDPVERDWQANPTILSGDIAGNDPAYGASFTFANMGDNAFHVVLGANGARLDGCTVRGGNADVATFGANSLGGGIVTGTSTELATLVKDFKFPTGSMTIANCVVENNSCDSPAGGIMMMRSGDVLARSIIRWNRAYAANDGADGGGVFCRGPQTIDGCMFIGNKAQLKPGNTGNNYTGGAITANLDTRVINSLFIANEAEFGGAIICSWSSSGARSTPQLIGCTFYANYADSQGGAIHISGRCDATIDNCLFAQGVGVEYGGDEIQFNEFNGYLPSLSITNCTMGAAGDLQSDGTSYSAAGLAYRAPAWVDAASPYGADGFAHTGDDGFRLVDGSLDIDTGIAVIGSNAEHDIRGFVRPSGSGHDRGAYEFSASPTVLLSAPAQVGTTFPMRANWSEAVTGFAAGDVGVTNGVVSGFTGSGASYNWTVTPAAEGTVTVTVAAGVAMDGSANANVAATPLVRIADFPPTVVLSSLASDPAKSAFTVMATFDEAPGTSFALGDILVGNGTASALAGSGLTRTFTVTPVVQGEVSVRIPAGTFANPNGVVSVADSNIFSTTFDSLKPTPVITSPAAPTVAGAFDITVTWSEPAYGFAVGDLTPTNATLSAFTGGDGDTEFTATVTPTAAGTVKVALAAGKATDAAGNASNAALTLTRNSEQSRPTVVLSSAATAVTKASPIVVTATFNEPVTGLESGDLVLVNASAAVSTVDGKVWALQLTPSGDGTVSVQVPADVASDLAGNLNQASAVLSRVSDGTGPTLTLTTTAADPTAGSFVVTITADEAVTGLLATDLVVASGTVVGLAGSGTTYTCTVRPSGTGLVTVNLPAGAVVDVAGNLSAAADELERTVTVANNDFADAIVLSGWKGSSSGANFGATNELGEPAHAALAAAASVWWTWTAPETGTVTIDTLGSLFDTQLAVYTGSDVAALTPVASNANASSGVLQSKVTLAVATGTTYRIAVDGKSGAKGLITLNWSLVADNNAFAKARAIGGTSGSDTSGTWHATRDSGENTFGGIGAGQTVWWSYAAPLDGTLTVDTSGSTIDTVLGVATGNAVNALTVKALDDDVPADTYAEIGIKVKAGQVYRIMVDASTASGTDGEVTLNWSLTPVPAGG